MNGCFSNLAFFFALLLLYPRLSYICNGLFRSPFSDNLYFYFGLFTSPFYSLIYISSEKPSTECSFRPLLHSDSSLLLTFSLTPTTMEKNRIFDIRGKEFEQGDVLREAGVTRQMGG